MDLPTLTIPENIDEQINSANVYRSYSKSAGIPERFLDAKFSNTSNRISDKVRSFAEVGKGVMVIFGDNGTGKTRTGCCAINHRIDIGLTGGEYISCNYQVCPMIRTSRSFKAEKNEMELLNYYYTIPFLVIDEAGKGDDSMISKAFLTSVLSARYANGLPTLIITNMTKTEFEAFVGKDITSRLSETGMYVVLNDTNFREAK